VAVTLVFLILLKVYPVTISPSIDRNHSH
jgi:hypothetical protein